MPPAPQPTDPRREHLRRQAILRRQAVRDRLAGVRMVVVGCVVAAVCTLVGYMEASAHTRPSTGASGLSASGTGGSSNSGYSNSGGSSSSQNLFAGGSAPTASAGGGSVVSGGS